MGENQKFCFIHVKCEIPINYLRRVGKCAIGYRGVEIREGSGLMIKFGNNLLTVFKDMSQDNIARVDRRYLKTEPQGTPTFKSLVEGNENKEDF